MDILLACVQYFVDLGAAVMLPLVIFVIALALGTPFGKALRSGISIGSIHGWIWVPMAFLGTIFGLRIRRHFGF